MPYIREERRTALASIDGLERPENAGELNYLISLMLIKAKDEDEVYTKVRYLVNAYLILNGLSYQHINDVSGALVNSEREYERRTGNKQYRNVMGRVLDHFYDTIAVPYEKKKIVQNGDIY